ncbi:MAG: hypothetical protein OQK82_03440 [Candidatus Pacearchaeota archaeon]|nr:hypothetical protein [Candidatus Pacearchaeota archaeon]
MARRTALRPEREDRIFYHSGNIYDMSGVKFLHQGVDTLKYLYKGKANLETYQMIKDLYDTTHSAIFGFADQMWMLGSGGASGYRYRLQNNDLGVIVFYGAKHGKISEEDNLIKHNLKVELSPHFLISRDAKQVDKFIDDLAGHFLTDMERPQLAVHLCIDVKGWQIPEDFDHRLKTRARRLFDYKGVSDYEFDLSATSVTYGRQETITYGKAGSLQFTVYDKTKANQKQDKVEFWEKQWKTKTNDNFEPWYQKGDKVHRIEFRFHHTVVEQFSRTVSKWKDSEGNDCILGSEKIRSFQKLEEHLTGLWRYAAMGFRLQLTDEFVDPFWALLLDDIEFLPARPDLNYKREYKSPGTGSDRNVVMAMANKLSVLVRRGYKAKDIFKSLKKDDIWPDIRSYYFSRGFDQKAIYDHVKQAVDKRILSGKAA